MKKYLFLLLFCASLVACKDNPVSKKIQETQETVSNTSNAVNEINKMQDDIKDLAEVTPLTNAELKEWLPDEVEGMKRISYKAGEVGMMGISSIEATYANEDKSKKFHVKLIDGAGQMGATLTASMRMMLSQDFEEEDEYEIRKTETKNGKKVILEYRKDNSESKIQFMEKNRFYIETEGENMSLDDTWDVIDDLNLDNLG
ncbi:putative periplasmic lipoprotein [Aequorivita viscosa]|uniref:Uncharacterized protein n=1 Tax=Aequorivita viscosa TaxID=797419 RepID=A0A1M6HAD4_9FLAO|nr:hypothetical protein [Aequorivita viscosa]SDW89938.1 hypothetical protein SAMN05216556_11227 [Aequorivita viscosa]SHJ19034.1 hypothetical protein SAMN04487908_11126 [Aequorivita viscosa]